MLTPPAQEYGGTLRAVLIRAPGPETSAFRADGWKCALGDKTFSGVTNGCLWAAVKSPCCFKLRILQSGAARTRQKPTSQSLAVLMTFQEQADAVWVSVCSKFQPGNWVGGNPSSVRLGVGVAGTPQTRGGQLFAGCAGRVREMGRRELGRLDILHLSAQDMGRREILSCMSDPSPRQLPTLTTGTGWEGGGPTSVFSGTGAVSVRGKWAGGIIARI